AMIVFIALILVAAVASAVIIQTGEKLQQNAQQTGDDTQREIGGKITINSAYINDATTMRLYFESAPGSGTLTTADIAWQVACTNLDPDGDGVPEEPAEPFGYQFTAGAFGDGNTADAELTPGDTFTMADPDGASAGDSSQTTIAPGSAYVIDVVVDGGANADCTFAEVGINGEITLWIHVEGGGSTYETVLISDTAPGSLLI
ncbi:MAG: hypothetical protein CL983_03805, partial [Euryarchaeota archaeon]|nr:hypothetical protein [Euryarchaeota archaeon]